MKNIVLASCTLVLLLSLTACNSTLKKAQRKPLNLVQNGKSDYVVVLDSESPTSKFAAKELLEILKTSTEVELKTVDAKSQEAAKAKKRVLLGDSVIMQEILSKELLTSLKDQESLVTSRGDDLILVGGGSWGTIYSVYDFLENEAGYRNFGAYPGSERFVKNENLVFSGKETRRCPAFAGFRDEYTLYSQPDRKAASKFLVRNRGNHGLIKSHANLPELKSKYQSNVSGHGLFRFVPPYDKKHWKGKFPLKGMYKEHPEYFTMNADGTRSDRLQLCFSNPDLRKLLTERIKLYIKTFGDGVYMVGATDHPGKFCHCPGCVKLEKKYGCIGGPLYDYILEICDEIKDEYPNVYITTLAYRKGQSEIPPENIVFPDNFIIDFAPVDDNWAVSLKEQKGNTYGNLKKWNDITKHVSYWYYTCVHAPYGLYERTQDDLKAMRDAGVQSIGLCGASSPDFNDLVTYVYFRLLLDPDQDVKKLVKEYCEHEFGAAASMMCDYLNALEKQRRECKTKVGCDDSYSHIPVKPKWIIKWQKRFDEMVKLVKNDPVRLKNVQMARVGLDIWTLLHFAKIRQTFPNEKLDADAVLPRTEKTIQDAKQAKRRITRYDIKAFKMPGAKWKIKERVIAATSRQTFIRAGYSSVAK